MMARVAAEIIQRAAFPPDVKITARAVPSFDSGYGYGRWAVPYGGESIRVEIRFDTFDSSLPGDDGVYRTRRAIAPVFELDVEDLHTEEELLHDVIYYLTLARQHEDREFTRVRRGEQWVAPFHPHTPSADLAWNRAEVDARRRLPSYGRV